MSPVDGVLVVLLVATVVPSLTMDIGFLYTLTSSLAAQFSSPPSSVAPPPQVVLYEPIYEGWKVAFCSVTDDGAPLARGETSLMSVMRTPGLRLVLVLASLASGSECVYTKVLLSPEVSCRGRTMTPDSSVAHWLASNPSRSLWRASKRMWASGITSSRRF